MAMFKKRRFRYLIGWGLAAGLVLACLAVANLGAAGPAGSCTVPGDHATIQAAVDDPACNLVDIAPGTFSEHVTIPTGRIVDIQGQGQGVTFMDGMAGGPIFFIEPGAVVSLCYMTIHDGLAGSGAGVYNDGTLAVISVTLSDNQVSQGGGAIFNSAGAVATITGTTLTDNTAGDQGGAIQNAGQMTVADSWFGGNAAGEGGAIYNSAGTLTVLSSTLSGNSAQDGGGGIFNWGTLTVSNSTLSGNSASWGGGIVNEDLGTVTVRSSTLSGNTAADGGGIFNWILGTVTVENSTLSGNSAADEGGGVFNDGGVSLGNTILANNSAPAGPDCAGIVNSQDYNLVEDPAGCTIMGSTGHNITGQDPLLGPLQDNGGPTWTRALAVGSPAVDAGYCPGVTADQRGLPRPVDVPFIPDAADGCDMGAFEFQNEWFLYLTLVYLTP
jgi:hypothetical protein